MMILEYELPLRKAKFVKRYKRFFVDVQLPNGSIEAVHCANSGSMKSCLVPDAPAYTLDSRNPERKLRHSLELLELDDGFACLNTSRANEFTENLLRLTVGQEKTPFFEKCQFPYAKFKAFDTVLREAVFSAHTRFDFCLTSSKQPGKKCWIEVKSVSLRLDENTWAFPDAVTERGQKHLNELMHAKKNGDDAWMFYVMMRGNNIPAEKLAKGFRAAHEIDPTYAKLLEKAKDAGVHVAVIVPHITLTGFSLREFVVLN